MDLCINQLLVEVGGMEYHVGQPPRISGLKGVELIKKLARELGKGKSPDSDSQVPPVGSKRDGKHIFEDDGEDSRTKKRCTKSGISQPTIDERSAVAAVQHRREQGFPLVGTAGGLGTPGQSERCI